MAGRTTIIGDGVVIVIVGVGVGRCGVHVDVIDGVGCIDVFDYGGDAVGDVDTADSGGVAVVSSVTVGLVVGMIVYVVMCCCCVDVGCVGEDAVGCVAVCIADGVVLLRVGLLVLPLVICMVLIVMG